MSYDVGQKDIFLMYSHCL